MRVDQFGQGVDVGAQQLAQAAVVEYLFDDGVFRLEAFEDLLGGDVLSLALGLLGLVGDFKFVEEHFAHLLGRGDVEFFARQLVDFLFDLAHAGREVFGCLPQGLRVDAHAVALHVGQHGDERHLYFLKQPAGVVLVEFLLQDVFQLQRDVGVFAGIAVDIGGREVAHVFLLAPFRADEFLDVDGLVFEVDFSQVVHAVAQFGLEDVVGYHGVEQRAAHFRAVVSQHEDVILDVLPDFQALFVGIDGFEPVDDALRFFASGRDGDVVGFALCKAEAHAHQFGQHGFGVGRFGVHGESVGLEQAADERVAVGVALHEVIVVGLVVECRQAGGGGFFLWRGVEQGEERARFGCGDGFFFLENAFDEVLELQFFEEGAQGVFVGLCADEGFEVERDGNVGLDGGEELREAYLLGVVLHFLPQRAFQAVGVGQEVVDAAKFGDELLCGLLADTGTTGDVVRTVAHESQQVDDLCGRVDAELLLHFLDAQRVELLVAVARAVHEHVFAHELAVVLVGGHHVGVDAAGAGLRGQRADDVVGFVAGHFEDGDMIGANDVFDEGD